jgi:hypothetical protein
VRFDFFPTYEYLREYEELLGNLSLMKSTMFWNSTKVGFANAVLVFGELVVFNMTIGVFYDD